ncbi:MAG: TolC family protein [Ignavibacteria bacterium]|nr:TolC family protein [Ignavibacteria bacterium]
MKKIFLIMTAFFFSVNIISAQELVTIQQAVNAAIKNNPNVSILEENINIQKQNKRTVTGDLIPNLNFSAGWSRNNTFSKGTTVYQNGIPFVLGDQTTAKSNYSLGLNSQVVLFDGFANYRKLDLSDQNIEASVLQLEKTKYDIMMDITQKYFDVLRKDRIVYINQDNLKTSVDQLDKIKVYVEVGKKTISEVYKQDVQVAQDELDLESSIRQLEKSKVDLLNAMNDDVNKEITVEVKDVNLDMTLGDLFNIMNKYDRIDDLVKSALSKRYDYLLGIQNIKIYETQFNIAKKYLYYPSLSAFGTFNVSGNQYDEIFNTRVFTFGLNLSYPIFQGFKLDVNSQIAEINIKQKNEDLRNITQQLKADIKKSVIDLQTAYKQIEILERNITAAEQDVILSEENYRVGYGTLLDMQVAVTRLNNLRIERVNAIYNFFLAQRQIDYLSGNLKY